MRPLLLTLLVLVLAVAPVSAVSLYWDETADGLLDVEYAEAPEGPWTFVKRIPGHPPYFVVEPGKFGYYRVTIPNGPSSNSAKYSLDLVEDVPTVNNITSRQIDADHIEILGQACTSLKTTGSGLKRIVECVK